MLPFFTVMNWKDAVGTFQPYKAETIRDGEVASPGVGRCLLFRSTPTSFMNGLSVHHLSDGYDDVISLEMGWCTKVPLRGCGIDCARPIFLGYSVQPHTWLSS